MSSKSDLRGAVEANIPVGVVAGKLSLVAQILTLPNYLDRGDIVFCDSGAFTSFQTGADIEWADIFRCYETLVGLRDSKRDLELKNSKLEERASARVRYTLRAVLSVFNELKKLSMAELSQTSPARLMLQVMPCSLSNSWKCSLVYWLPWSE